MLLSFYEISGIFKTNRDLLVFCAFLNNVNGD